jgi:hypothetical protein
VVKKGGKLAIVDVRHAYARELEACGLKINDHRSLGACWVPTRLVAAIKPSNQLITLLSRLSTVQNSPRQHHAH